MFYRLHNFDWKLGGDWNNSFKIYLRLLVYLWFLGGCCYLNLQCQKKHGIISSNIYHMLKDAFCQTCATCITIISPHYCQNMQQCLAYNRLLKQWLWNRWINQPTIRKGCSCDLNIDLSDFKLLGLCSILLFLKGSNFG